MLAPSDTIMGGYDVDELSEQLDAAGGGAGFAMLAVAAKQIDKSPSSSSLGNAGQMVLADEAAGLTIKQTIAALVAVFGTGVLAIIAYFVYNGAHQGSETPSNPPGGGGRNPNGDPAPGNNGTGTVGGPVSGGGGVGAQQINLVVQNWQQRIASRHVGASTLDKTQITTDVLKTAAKQCLQLAAAAAALGGIDFSSGNPCVDERIFFPAGGDAQAAAQHDLDAMTGGHPEWAQLNYMSGINKDPQVPAGWYTRAPYWSVSGCKQAASPSIQCDEYPFRKTTQGGPVVMGGDGASLRPIKAAENEAEGRAYGAMVATGFCDMQSAPAVPRGTRATGGTPFLVVPLPDVSVPSFFLC